MRSIGLALTALTLFAGACSSEPSSTTPDGGVPTEGAPCEVDGYPCAPGQQTDAALALSEQYKAEIQDRRAKGDSYLDIANWLREQDSVVDVVAADDRLRFRVEGGSAHWAYAPSSAHPQASLPPFEGAGSSTSPKAVLREDSSETKIKKKGLILEPFHFQFLSNTAAWKERIELLHDYDRVDYFRNRDIPDENFGNWNDYRFVWVLSHGAYLPTEANPQYTAIYSAKECGMYQWFATDVRASEVGLDGMTRIATLLGLPRSEVESQLTEAQRARWHAFRDREARELTNKGQGCGVLEMPDADLPVMDDNGEPIVRTPAFLDYIYYDKAWFDTKYSSGLDNVLLYLSVCASSAVRIPSGSSGPSSVLGWSKPMDALLDNDATDVFFERLFEFGDTVEDAFDKVTEAGLSTHTFDGATTELSHESLNDGDIARTREIVTIVDSVGFVPLPDEGGMLEAREITANGDTLVDVTVEIVGFGQRDADEFKVQIFDGNGRAISAERVVDDPIAGETLMTITASLNQEIRTPTEVEIEARVKLPEELGQKDSRHPIKVTVGPAIDALWTLNVGGAGTARGDFVFAPFPIGLMDEEGRLVWQVTLARLDNFVVPSATLFIVGHNGRTPECTGQTGNFDALVAVQFDNNPMPTIAYGGGLGEGECGDAVNIEIVSFSKEEDLVANISGTICEFRKVGDEEVITPVPINGSFQMPAAGCGADPGGDLIGSYKVSEEPSLCFDIYPNAAIAAAFEQTCMAGGGLVCSDEPCPTAGQIGECDYRDDSVQLSFRGQVTHFLAGGDWPPVGDLQLACELQLGIWTTGEAAAP